MNGNSEFLPQERSAIYRCIRTRRDVRGEFLPDPVPGDVLARLLQAAHHAPSVGFMQPWNFIIVRDPTVKQRIYDGFLEAHEEAADQFAPEKAKLYRSLKLEGIREAPVGICVTCDRTRSGPVILGRTHQSNMDLYSSVCAVQNLWLAARAEGIGVGWMSIIRPEDLKAVLQIPSEISLIAYLCVGYVRRFHDRPELESRGWRQRLCLRDIVSFDAWGERTGGGGLTEHLDSPETASPSPHVIGLPLGANATPSKSTEPAC